MTQRSLKVERLYTLGDYKNIKFTDEINDLPESVAFNPEAISRLRLLQLVGLELSYKRYLELGKDMGNVEDAQKYLEKVRLDLTEELKHLLNENKTETIENKEN